jgi:hypothetical protein
MPQHKAEAIVVFGGGAAIAAGPEGRRAGLGPQGDRLLDAADLYRAASPRSSLRAAAAGRHPRTLMVSGKLRAMGWRPTTPLRAGIARTCRWFLDHITGKAPACRTPATAAPAIYANYQEHHDNDIRGHGDVQLR